METKMYIPRAINTSRAAASLLVSGYGTKFSGTIKEVKHTDGVGGRLGQKFTREDFFLANSAFSFSN